VYDFSEFKPRKKGLGKVLGDLEAEVMDAIWAYAPCSVRDIYKNLRSKRTIAYTTVMTIMSRLADKGLLIKEKEGPAFRYCPAVSREEFRTIVASEVIDGLLDGFGKEAFSRLIEKTGKANPEVIAELERILEERKKRR
jgi:predicted transcriptional regulator